MNRRHNGHTAAPWRVSPFGGLIESVEGGEVVGLACSLPEKAANARLLAAAPEMLRLLECVLEYLETLGTDGTRVAPIAEIEAIRDLLKQLR